MCNNISHRSWSEAGFKQRSTEVKDGEGNHSKPSCRNVESQRCQKSPWFSRFLDCVIQCHSNTKTLRLQDQWLVQAQQRVRHCVVQWSHSCMQILYADWPFNKCRPWHQQLSQQKIWISTSFNRRAAFNFKNLCYQQKVLNGKKIKQRWLSKTYRKWLCQDWDWMIVNIPVKTVCL